MDHTQNSNIGQVCDFPNDVKPNSTLPRIRYARNKIRQDDPDMGAWAYTYNALDQLTSQTNANNKTTTMEYDLLGRMTQRTSPEGTAEWFFDNPGEGGKLGAPWREELRDSSNVLVQRKTYAYDALKRPMLELMNHDNKWFYTTFRYDARSRLQHTDWFWRPQSIIDSGDNLSPNWNNFSMEYVYDDDTGYLTAVKDGTGHEWWSCTLSDYDEQGRVVGFTQGNDVATAVNFNPLTGLVDGIDISNIGAGSQEYGFGYDRLGNLTSRSLARTGQSTLSEACGYDALNRLLTTTVGGATASATYDSLGNIKTKTGIAGTYVYGSARPHAVTSADGVAYTYDSCGNMLTRTEGTNTSSITWTSFNKPLRIERGTNASEFTYDANQTRVTQLIDSGGTLKKKIYIGNRMEQEENPDGSGGWTNTLTRIFVSTPSGVIGIEERTPSQTTRKYLHRDPLGSVVAVSGETQSGNAPILAEYSFDAWGAHRNPANWTATTSNLTTVISGDRGFTGHEMLDGIVLVHMNGRIYSQELGRFLSPDPLIQAPGNLQSFNRYSYVMNRPLTLTDPSGFAAKKQAAASEAATASTQLSTSIQSDETASQDNTGGETGAESSEQVNDYYSDGTNIQVDQSTVPKSNKGAGGNYYKKGEGLKSPFESRRNKGAGHARGRVKGAGYGMDTGSERAQRQAAAGNKYAVDVASFGGNVARRPDNILDDILVDTGLGLYVKNNTLKGDIVVDLSRLSPAEAKAVMASFQNINVKYASGGIDLTIRTPNQGETAIVTVNNTGKRAYDGRYRSHEQGEEIFGRSIDLAMENTTFNGSVSTHEFGHLIGLQHQENHTGSLMSYNPSRQSSPNGDEVGRLLDAYR